jgi:ABC-2 type transport system ATP-binding protein
LAVTFQNPALDPWLTVEENLHVHRSLWAQSQTLPQPGSREDDDERVLKLLGVSELRRRRVKTLSGGQARRVELCKVLMGGPRVLLLDEPTTGLDPSARHDFWSALSELKNQSMTILVTTHLFEEAALADHLVFLSAGQVADAFDLKGLSSRQVARFSALRSDGPEAEFQLRSNIEKLVSDFGLKSRWQGAECFVDLAKFEQSADLLRGLSRFGAFHFQVGAWSLADLYFEKTGKTLK